jgi:uncharacterized protein with beta-barrel porin domain
MIAGIFLVGFGIRNSRLNGTQFHRRLLITAGLAAALLAAPSGAWAQCSTSGTDPVTVTCAVNTATNNTTNTTSPNPATSDRVQQFGADLSGQVNTGVTVSNYGLNLVTTKSNGGINFTNNGAINSNDSVSALRLDGNGGTVSYTGSGSITGGTSQNGLVLTNTSGNIRVTETGPISAGAIGLQATTGNGGDIELTVKQVEANGSSAAIVTSATTGTTTVHLLSGLSSANLGDGLDAHATTGKIAVTIDAFLTSGASAGTGVALFGGNGNTVINNGVLFNGVGISANTGNVSIYNGGRISASTLVAIQFAGTGNTLTIAPTAFFFGNVLGTGADLFQLGGPGTGTFDIAQIGPAAMYRGFGSFGKVDDSTWTLTGINATAMPWTVKQGTLNVATDMANSSFTVQDGLLSIASAGTIGSATVNGGTMNVLSGGVAGPATVNGGVLTGEGTVGSTQINAGGTFAPGTIASAGTSMTVSGNLAFQSGALYLVFLDPATSSFANVTGTATLNGLVAANFATGTYVAKRYTILTAASGVSGTFAGIDSLGLPSGFKESLSYDATHAYLDLALAFAPPSGTLNINQQNVANAIVAFFNANGGIPLVFGGLTPAGLTQLSGEGTVGSQQATFDAMSQFINLLIDPFISGRGDPISAGGGSTGYADETPAYAAKRRTDAFAMFTKAPPVTPFTQRWSVWAAGFGGSQRTDGNAILGSNDTSSSIFGTAVGLDYRLTPNTLAGFALAGGGTNFSVNTLGSGRSDLFQAGAFARHNIGPAYITGALAYGWQDITTDRFVTVAGLDHLRAQFNANAWSGRIEGGYRFVAPIAGGVGITPYAAAQFVSFDLPAYMEQAIVGANTFALGYNAKTATDGRSEFGIRTDKSFAAQNGIFTLRGRLAWAHDYDPDRNILATFQTLPGASFVVNGATHAADSALTTASAEWKWISGWSAAATFEGEFSNASRSYAGKGVVRYAW